MPKFYQEVDFDVCSNIETDEFLDKCSENEINEVIDYLEEMGYLKDLKRLSGSTTGFLEEEFQERIQKISESRHRLTLEEEDLIRKISDRL